MARIIREKAAGLAIALACLAAPALLPARAAGPLVPAKADILSVEVARKPMRTVEWSGAGLRAPHRAPDPPDSERVRVDWFAHSPGIPPGTLIMLETIPERRGTVLNHVQRMNGKSEGHLTAEFAIPDDEMRESGPIGAWRVRVIWRGRALATRTSPGWNAARKGLP